MTVSAYRDRTSGEYPLSLSDVRRRSNMAFGGEPTSEVLDSAGVNPVEAKPQPSFDPAKKTIAEGPPAKTNGVWQQTWVLSDIPPPEERTLTWLEFMDLFTEPEQVELAGAAMTDPTMKLWYDRALGAQGIFLSDSRTTVGVDYAIANGLIPADRRADILAGKAPNV